MRGHDPMHGHDPNYCDDFVEQGDDASREAAKRMSVRGPSPEPSPSGAARCENFSPPWFVGPWRDWHRGHGCALDDGQPRSQAAKNEIANEYLRAARAVEAYAQWCGSVHDEGCPEDDTCDCSGKWINDGVTAAVNFLKRLEW